MQDFVLDILGREKVCRDLANTLVASEAVEGVSLQSEYGRGSLVKLGCKSGFVTDGNSENNFVLCNTNATWQRNSTACICMELVLTLVFSSVFLCT